ncbi:cell envelope integrity protein CreD [Ferruginibacter sp. HRS2-29]|uniref:cell envelope integrity protein CreD n=1 Tax=Ferruginibacter sp. HRS2-29 TaxID=2487334 RepID=UPI0020CBB67E|nr:cell envelope integrity protein CreD [Ferruginibacter sp. HRS2-29]MCP9751698.1 cell envelope integrity protein CreD [Ferruginibacter sp. HRS2-29]
MKKEYSTLGTSARIWVLTAFFTALVINVCLSINAHDFNLGVPVIIFVVTLICRTPVLITLVLTLKFIKRIFSSIQVRCFSLLALLLLVTLPYALLGASASVISDIFYGSGHLAFFETMVIVIGVLFGSALLAAVLLAKRIFNYLYDNTAPDDSFQFISQTLFHNTSKTHTIMETSYSTPPNPVPASNQPNRILIKGLVTGGLILLMLIPTVFINSLISEREKRQKEVVKEVSSKWANAQTLSAPFLVVPYTDTFVNSEGKAVANKTKLLLLANDLNVNGKIIPEQRPRSIYKVLLYKTDISFAGSFKVSLPQDIQAANVDYANARLCFTLSDFKGIEEEIYVNFNGQKLLMSPGLPVDDFGNIGLSVPVSLTAEQMAGSMPFSMQVKIKGSEELHFTPLAAASKYTLSSAWPNASFNGESLPGERKISDSGFVASWNFNQANLPFAKVMKTNSAQVKSMEFGVSLVQTADQYDKTMRSVKYAILFIGLTFAFFFIIELMQKKPFHPVQYVLVGLALVIFYTLLLSISEYILFNHAYIIASLATVLLISFYAKAHFNSWKTGGIFFTLLGCLYGFIFILISLEDTALLVGSIGLFIVLSLVMFASRRINWYGANADDGRQINHNQPPTTDQ